MPYFCGVFARSDAGWIGTEPDLSEVTGLDDIADIMREAAVETAGETVVLLVEQEDEWFSVVRLDDGEDPRVFLSDGRAPQSSELAEMLSEQLDAPAETASEEPIGDPELLADLGTTSEALSALGERTLPGDALSVIAEGAGFAEEYERLR
ncbi:tRNA adenosine deaminase-associated protein [Actinoallomurus rhizosphaericola]|uniref:tRNA adenosine deaminase-associated protein n=1 Tax=Actinoallomurus rhizosphaericola TaxID=2952536 RepID=UPI002093F8AA|nr:tRNA adenosine deaminase-associated protein [Actinoallomurus rhizosphaericola]MCO5995032.1 tRNA adenosine deaminase-associated protein [Actinoallomurus rhizosphaericola]